MAEQAVAAARRAFVGWAGRSVIERRNAIRKATEKLAALREEVAVLLTREMGKPLAQARGEVGNAIDTMQSFGELIVHLRAGSQMSGANELNFQHRTARGVAACIIPWNFPIAVGLENVVPNLLVGNTVIWKPSEKTPLSSRLVVEKVFDHLPHGVLNLVLGDGSAGEPLVTSEDVDLVVFVGSERTGRRIGALCGGGLKKVVLELGGEDLPSSTKPSMSGTPRASPPRRPISMPGDLHLDGAVVCRRRDFWRICRGAGQGIGGVEARRRP